MISTPNEVVWLQREVEEEGEAEGEGDSVSWSASNKTTQMTSLASFKSLLEDEWYANVNVNVNENPNQNQFHNLSSALQPMDSSSSCSQSSVFNLDPYQTHSYLPPKPIFSSLLNAVCTNPLDGSFDLGCEQGFLAPLDENPPSNSSVLMNREVGLMGFNGSDPNSISHFQATHLLQLPENGFNSQGFDNFECSMNPLFLNRSKELRPLEIFPSIGSSEPTLFQKRALRRNSGENLGNFGFSGEIPVRIDGDRGKRRIEGEEEKISRKCINFNDEDDMDELSIDGSGLIYDSDDQTDIHRLDDNVNNGGNNSNANSTVTGGDQKGKKKGLPAKNLMAERRRRKKLNDRLYMLRSVVPKISKMDRASILGDAIEYLKELLQRINELHNELETTPPGSSLPASSTTSFHPMTPTTLPPMPFNVKEELGSTSLSSPNQPARVEVRVREGRAVNIHMFCARKPGLLLSTMRALDNLGLDIQQAVISCFNGFALDVFRAEQCKEGLEILPEQIKAVLLDTAGFLGTV